MQIGFSKGDKWNLGMLSKKDSGSLIEEVHKVNPTMEIAEEWPNEASVGQPFFTAAYLELGTSL
jgi:hypothetical protein